MPKCSMASESKRRVGGQMFTSETWTFAVFLCQTLYELCAPQFKSDIYTDSLSNENKALILRHII